MQRTDIQAEANCWKRFKNRCRASLRRLLTTNVNIFLQGDEIGNMVVDNESMQVTIKIINDSNTLAPSPKIGEINSQLPVEKTKGDELSQSVDPKRYWDEFIDTYTKISETLHMKGENVQLQKLQKMILNKMKSLGIVSSSVETNIDFDGETMEVSKISMPISTNSEDLNGKVAKVITPVFYFQPKYNSQEGQFMLKKAEVILYELSE